MEKIPLSQGKVAVVDDEDYEHLNRHTWYASKAVTKTGEVWYAKRYERLGKWRYGKVYMHRELLPGVRRIDHRDGDGLHNWRSNLRQATQTQNNMNRRKGVNTSSRFKGVHWHKAAGRWASEIGFAGVRKYLGLFDSEEDAARAYDAAAKILCAEFALTNFKNKI
jgi:AP2 domain